MRKWGVVAGVILNSFLFSQVGDTTIVTEQDKPVSEIDTVVKVIQDAREHTEQQFRDDIPAVKPEPVHRDTLTDAFSLSLPPQRNGSGTSWHPDESRNHAVIKYRGRWAYLMMWNMFPRYTFQNFNNQGMRGDRAMGAPNWFALRSTSERNEKNLFTWGFMISLDPVTEGNEGYPLLFQTGEAFRSAPLVDRQHPHDGLSSIYMGYTRRISNDLDISFYGAPVGEPALGPPVYMQRPSALYLADAPLSHHAQDGTHTVFGVLTTGVRTGKFKSEFSWFNGSEPDERRWIPDELRLNSFSGRISYNPTHRHALQVSAGHLNSPEALHPGEDVEKFSASLLGSRVAAFSNYFDYALVYGLNRKQGLLLSSYLAEASFKVFRINFAARIEQVEKTADELVITSFDENRIFDVRHFTFAPSYDIVRMNNSIIAGGVAFQIYHVDHDLKRFYGDSPMGFQIFLRFHPKPIEHTPHNSKDHQ